jgi:hypothetical protein
MLSKYSELMVQNKRIQMLKKHTTRFKSNGLYFSLLPYLEQPRNNIIYTVN